MENNDKPQDLPGLFGLPHADRDLPLSHESVLDPICLDSPIAVGGLGGSGTRLIAAVMRAGRMYLGADLNDALDNLWFTLLFKSADILRCSSSQFKAISTAFCRAMTSRGPLTGELVASVEASGTQLIHRYGETWVRDRRSSLLRSCYADREHIRVAWGWKEPNTHIVMPRLLQAMPKMRYIYVVRHGLDMAYSSNQNQLKLWGPHMLGPATAIATPENALKFWVMSHRRAMWIKTLMGDRFLLMNYDRLCADPENEGRALLDFLGISDAPAAIECLKETIRASPGIGRFRRHAISPFCREDLAYVAAAGFDVS